MQTLCNAEKFVYAFNSTSLYVMWSVTFEIFVFLNYLYLLLVFFYKKKCILSTIMLCEQLKSTTTL